MKRAAVAVTVATLWAAPDLTRPSDAAALRDEPDIGAWIAAMTPGEQIDSGVVTQLLLGDRVLVGEVRPDGWARVVAPGQPAPGLDARGVGVHHMEITSTQPIPVGVDGEALVLDPPLRFVIRPAVLRVRIAPQHPGASPTAGAAGSFIDFLRQLFAVAVGRAPPDEVGGRVVRQVKRWLGLTSGEETFADPRRTAR